MRVTCIDIRFIRSVLLICGTLMQLLVSLPVFAGIDEAEEISVFVTVRDAGSLELPAFINGQDVYLPVAGVLGFLHIRHKRSRDNPAISGVHLDGRPYTLSFDSLRVIWKDSMLQLPPSSIINAPGDLYLRMDHWEAVFGLKCSFHFRSLSVDIVSALELPVVKERKLEQMRRNISRLNNQEEADTSIAQSYPLFSFGAADWSVIANQGGNRNQLTANLGIGAVIAGGETNVSLIYNSARRFNGRDQYYQWRRTNNDSRLLKQVIAGKVYAGSISSLFSPVVGIQLTNSPTGFRRSFGSYNISNTTNPGETVELYVNNELVDYNKADAAGFYTFEVPMVYGTSEVKLKYYGLFGEERTRIQNISVPFNFTPPGIFEYTATGGVVEDAGNSRFGRGSFNYGVSKEFTVGGGLEYLSSVTPQPFIPFVNGSLRLARGLMLSADYAYGVRARGIIGYRLPNNSQLEINYTRYHPGQTAINYNFKEQRKIILSTPVRARGISLYSRITLNQIVLASSDYSTAEWQISGSVGKAVAHLTTYGVFVESKPYIYSNLAVTFRLPRGFILTPECQYDYNNKTLISARGRLEKNLKNNGAFNIFYEQNFRAGVQNVGMELRFDLQFGQVGFIARKLNDQLHFLQSARGSIRYAPSVNYLGLTSGNSIGRGNIVVIPFLDYNSNGERDGDEPGAPGVKLASHVGRVQESQKDTTIRIFDLEPYSNYLLEIDASSFENISWQLSKKSFSVHVDPNQFKAVFVPVSVMAEVSGKIYQQGKDGVKEQGQISVCFYRDDSTQIARTLSEQDGYFNYFGLQAGTYKIRIDPVQLKKLHLIAVPEEQTIVVKKQSDGMIIEHLDFVLQPAPPDVDETDD